MITYNYCDADGHERGDMGKGKPKVKRIYVLDSIDTGNRLAHVHGHDVWGMVHYQRLPLHTLTKLEPVIER